MDWSAVIERLAALLDEHYLDRDVAAIVTAMLRKRHAAGAYADAADEAALAAAVSADTVATSGDLHLQLRHSVVPLPGDAVVPESGRHPEEVRLAGFGVRRVEVLAGNVGLVELERQFPLSMARDAVAAALRLVAGTDALLLDLRGGGGGEPEMVEFVAAHLVDEPSPLSALVFPRTGERIEWRADPAAVVGPRFGGTKPLWVLIGAATASAGEGLAYDLQQAGRAVLVGGSTAGAAYFDYRYHVTDHLMFSVPSGYPVNPVSGEHWERTGVQPDVEAADAFRSGYRLALEHVLTLGATGHRAATHAQAAATLAGR